MANKEKIWLRLGKLLFTGVAAIAPLVGTAWLVHMLCKGVLKVGELMVQCVCDAAASILGEKIVLDFIGIEFVYFTLPLIALLLLGCVLASPVGERVQKFLECVVMKLPLVGFVYKSLEQFVNALRGLGSEKKFKSVVYIEYPSPGCRLLGFVTGGYHDEMRGCGVTSVFVPTSPNPLTGFMLLVDDDKVQPCPMSVEEASKMVLSAGLVTPHAEEVA